MINLTNILFQGDIIFMDNIGLWKYRFMELSVYGNIGLWKYRFMEVLLYRDIFLNGNTVLFKYCIVKFWNDNELTLISLKRSDEKLSRNMNAVK